MRLREAVDHELWGRRIMHIRSLDSFRAYGAETGATEFAKGWSKFRFSGDARDLALTPANIKNLANETYDHALRDGLKAPRIEWDDPNRRISPRERNTWLAGFLEAYTEELEEQVSDLIPAQIRPHLRVFCSIVTALQYDAEAGNNTADFGAVLGARKNEPEPKIHPDRAEIISRANREGRNEGLMHWNWQVNGDTPIRRPWFVHAPFDWDINVNEEELFVREYEAAYMAVLYDKIRSFAPPKAWKNAFLICSLYDEMEHQRTRGRSRDTNRGWPYLRNSREHDLVMTQRRNEEREKALNKRYSTPALGAAGPSGPLFSSRNLRITPGAQAAFEESGEQPIKYLERHFSGDFGESNLTDDRERNLDNIRTRNMVMSIYKLSTGTRIYIITDEGHRDTTFLLPEEY